MERYRNCCRIANLMMVLSSQARSAGIAVTQRRVDFLPHMGEPVDRSLRNLAERRGSSLLPFKFCEDNYKFEEWGRIPPQLNHSALLLCPMEHGLFLARLTSQI